MTLHKILIGILFCGVALGGNAQTTDSTSLNKNHRWALYAGVGPNYYFNNLVVGKNKVNEINYAYTGRLMWEPEFFLSVGLEVGYNRLYTLEGNLPNNNGTIRITNVAVPIQFVVSMKFLKSFYGNFNVGHAFLTNNVSTSNFGSDSASLLSTADFAASLGYRRPISDRFLLGVELRGYYSTKLEDKNLALLFTGGYRLW